MNVKSLMILLAVFGLTACASSGSGNNAVQNSTKTSQTASQEQKSTVGMEIACDGERPMNTRFARKKCRASSPAQASKTNTTESSSGGSN